MTAPTTFEIGTTLSGCVTLSSLGIVDPEYNFQDYSRRITLGSGLSRGLGFPVAEWHYGFLTPEQFDAFKVFAVDNSASIFIATYNNDRDLLRYSCVMDLPDKYATREKGQNSGEWRYMDVLITFSRLVNAE